MINALVIGGIVGAFINYFIHAREKETEKFNKQDLEHIILYFMFAILIIIGAILWN